MNDTIYRQAAIEAIKGLLDSMLETDTIGFYEIENILFEVPSAQPEAREIGYAECANAMLKMWIDNVLTDGEYNRIMDKLNDYHNAERRQDDGRS